MRAGGPGPAVVTAVLLWSSSTVPSSAKPVFVASGAVLIGRVTVSAGACIWYGAVLRADYDSISVGERSNIQDGCVLHADPGVPLSLGSDVTIGHNATLHGMHRRGPGPHRHGRDRAQRGARGTSRSSRAGAPSSPKGSRSRRECWWPG